MEDRISDPIRAYAEGKLARSSLMELLGTDDFGAVLALLRERGFHLPRAPRAGREAHLRVLAAAIEASRDG